MMIREKVTNKGATGNKGFLLIVVISIVIILLSSIVGYVENKFGIRHLEYLIYAILIVIASVLIKKYITEYRYSFFDDEVIIERMQGKKIEPVMTARVWDILQFGKLSDTKWKDDDIKPEFYDVDRKDAYVIVYKRQGLKYAAVFNPSKEFTYQLTKAIKQDDEVIPESNIIT